MKNIFFYSPYTVYPFHFETDLELIQQHIDEGDQVTFLTCDGELKSCTPNPFHIYERCQSCIQRRHNGFDLLKITSDVYFKPWRFLTDKDQEIVKQYKTKCINEIDQLKAVYYENYDLGNSILSMIIDITKEPYPDLQKWHEFIARNLTSCLEVYLSIKNHISSQDYQTLYLFNGRSLSLRAALRAAQSSNIELVVHERAGAFNKYELTYGTYPHDLEYQKQQISDYWEKSQEFDLTKQSKACHWFNTRRSGKPQGWYSFSAKQFQKLPPNFDRKKINIAIFNSSENEFATIDDWQNPIYYDQNEGLEKIIEDFSSDLDFDFYLRVHPNLKRIKSSQTRFIKTLKNKYKNFHVIDAEQKYSSYSLLEACDLTITFGSTMGIEAAFWKKPSLLLGRAIYEDLNTCLKVRSHQELVSLLQNRNFHLDDEKLNLYYLNSLKYGYYMEDSGIPFKIFQQDKVTKLNQNGIRIKDNQSVIDKLIWKLKYFYMLYR